MDLAISYQMIMKLGRDILWVEIFSYWGHSQERATFLDGTDFKLIDLGAIQTLSSKFKVKIPKIYSTSNDRL